jgi:uncharacterized protein YgiM (DUF1202 family)
MTRQFLWLVMVLCMCVPSLAQQIPTPTPSRPSPIRVVVDAVDAFVRSAPSFDATPVASVFKGEILEIVSRNLDGTWFEVRRPNRLSNLGWIFNNIYEKADFLPENLPLGDFVTGVIGDTPLTEVSLYGAFVLEGPALRTLPSRTEGTRIINIPPLVTIPVISRTEDGAWFKVNYLGYEGWIIAFTTRNSRATDRKNIPIDPLNYVSPESITVVIIPPEVQQAQVDNVRAYIAPRRELAVSLENLWWRVFRGEVMPCNAPEFQSGYPYTEEDVRELPELQRVAPRLGDAIEYLTEASEPLLNCGIIEPADVVEARDAAINARLIFDATLDRLIIIEEEINRFTSP